MSDKPKEDTLPDAQPKFTRKQKDEIMSLMVCVLNAAHDIVEAAIEGRPVSAKRVEGYYSAWAELLTEAEFQGCLVNDETMDAIDERI